MKSTQKMKQLHIATIGKTVGLYGEMKFHDKSDFPEQFAKGTTFSTEKKYTVNGISVNSVTISSINVDRQTIMFEGVNSIESAKVLTNAKLYTTYEATRESINLKEDEFFWFDLENLEVYEEGELLGVVNEVERIGPSDFLSVKSEASLVEDGFVKSFLIPYVKEVYILSVNLKENRIEVKGAKDLLEAS
jgi:16S rRNA processing protein RimM